MFHVSRFSSMRVPSARRPRQRFYEVFNSKQVGLNEGSQNMRVWLFLACLTTSATCVMLYYQAQRLILRGDTCPACEASRAHYQVKILQKEREAAAIRELHSLK